MASDEMGFSAQGPERDCILTITQMNLSETLPVEPPDKNSAQTNHLIAILSDTSNQKTPPSCTACFLFEAAKCWDLVNVAVYY